MPERHDVDPAGSDIERGSLVQVARIQVLRACGELPPGSATEQLRNFCGRTWEILHTPTQVALYRLWIGQTPSDPDLARFYATEVYRPLHAMMTRIVIRGRETGEFRTAMPSAAARVILAALVEQAFWCNHVDAVGPAVGGCTRVVADTLAVVLGGIAAQSYNLTTS
jgi:transcriptional repressor AefR-like protein